MTIDLTRRTLLHLAGASSLGAAAIAAAQAEGAAGGGGPTFANRTPMRIGMVTLRVRNLDLVADYYRDAIGLTVMARSVTSARLGSGGVALLDLQQRESAPLEARNAAGLYPPITSSANPSISTTPKATASRSMPIARPKPGNGMAARSRWQPTSSTSTACWR